MQKHFIESRSEGTPVPPDDDEAPVITVTRSTKGGLLIVGRCPYCSGRHVHGAVGPAFGAGDGLRVSHCHTGSYVLREVRGRPVADVEAKR